VVGKWEGAEGSAVNNERESTVGVDLEYKINFK
jgi:hypothetical protein